MWDDEKPKPVGAIDHDGWGYIYYGPEYNYLAATNGTAFNFAQAADNFIHNAQAANAATAPTRISAKMRQRSTWAADEGQTCDAQGAQLQGARQMNLLDGGSPTLPI